MVIIIILSLSSLLLLLIFYIIIISINLSNPIGLWNWGLSLRSTFSFA